MMLHPTNGPKSCAKGVRKISQESAVVPGRKSSALVEHSPSDAYELNDVQQIWNTLTKNIPAGINHYNVPWMKTQRKGLVRPRKLLNVGYFNVLTLKSDVNQTELSLDMKHFNIDICCMSECRIDGDTLLKTPVPDDDSVITVRCSGWTGQEDNGYTSKGTGGVGLAMNRLAANAMMSWHPTSGRVCAGRFESDVSTNKRQKRKRGLFVVSVYAPTEAAPQTHKTRFYEDLRETLLMRQPGDITIIAGDLNAALGPLQPAEIGSVGGSCSLKYANNSEQTVVQRSANGQALIDWCAMNRMWLASTAFRHKRVHTATFRPNTGTAMRQIDHLMIDKRWRSSVTNVRSHWGTHRASYHALVVASIVLRFVSPQRTIRHIKSNVQRLRSPEIRDAYAEKVIETLPNIAETDGTTAWSNLQRTMTQAAQQVCGIVKGQRVQSYMSERTIGLITNRRNVKRSTAQWRQLCTDIKNSAKEDRNLHWAEKTREIREAADVNDMHKLFDLCSRLCGRRTKSTIDGHIMSSDGTIICDSNDKMSAWRNHFQQQFNAPPATRPLDAVAGMNCTVDASPPTKEELCLAVKKLKIRKAPGPDDIASEMWRAAPPIVIEHLKSICAWVWKEGRVPAQWGSSICVPIFKKGNKQQCANYRGISLLCSVTKIIETVIGNRLHEWRERVAREQQAGFRSGRGCADHIFTLQQLLQTRNAFKQPTAVAFLDIKGAFDSVDRLQLWTALEKIGIPDPLTAVLKALYEVQETTIRVYNELSPPFTPKSGVWQGAVLSPTLFAITMDVICSETCRLVPECGIKMTAKNGTLDSFDSLEFADDIAVMADDEQKLQSFLNHIIVAAERFGLRFAPQKCAVMCNNWPNEPNITMNGVQIPRVDAFKYLGVRFTPTGSTDEEVGRRLQLAAAAFSSMGKIWYNQNIDRRIRVMLYEACVRSVLLYGCHAWTLKSTIIQKIRAFDNTRLRRIMNVWWHEMRTNRSVQTAAFKERVATHGDIETIVKRRQLRWIGHVLRMPPDRLPRRAMMCYAANEWKRPPGGRLTTWRKMTHEMLDDSVKDNRGRKDYSTKHFARENYVQFFELLSTATADRSKWRSTVEQLVTGKNVNITIMGSDGPRGPAGYALRARR